MPHHAEKENLPLPRTPPGGLKEKGLPDENAIKALKDNRFPPQKATVQLPFSQLKSLWPIKVHFVT